MRKTIKDICDWATKRPFWERFLFNKLLLKEEITNQDYTTALSYLLEDVGLIKTKTKRPELALTINDSKETTPSEKITLIELTNISGVNQLAAGQRLTFSPQLTVNYGENGAGKSGYARIFNCAATSRTHEQVLPDITSEACCLITPSVTFNFNKSGDTQSINHELTAPCSALSGFYCFDSAAVNIHLSSKNKFSFSPAGLELLTHLATETDIVRDLLRKEISKKTVLNNFNKLFTGGKTVISEFVEQCGAQTSINYLEEIANFSKKDQFALKDLSTKITKLRNLNIPQQIKSTKLNQTDLVKLSATLEKIALSLSEGEVANATKEIQNYQVAKATAKQLGADQFKTETFNHIGSSAWQELIASARKITTTPSNKLEAYPQQGDICLLCHQPLSTSAVEHFKQLWTFIEGKAQTELTKAQHIASSRYKTLKKLDTKFFNEDSPSYRYLKSTKPELAQTVLDFLTTCQQRLEKLLESYSSAQATSIPDLPPTCVHLIKLEADQLETKIKALETKNPTKEILAHETQLLLLTHKKILAEQKEAIKEYISNLAWAAKATKHIGNTRKISEKYNELFNKLITEDYLKTFNAYLTKLGRPFNVTIDIKNPKAGAYRKILIESDTYYPKKIDVDKILSEGEKRAVALSDFLTEASLDDQSCGMILDDPVTSLDIAWREKIAELLVSESLNKQVIVFTHDLPFLYYLKEHAAIDNIDMQNHWIRKSDENTPGHVYLNNSPALERDYRKATRAEELYKTAKDNSPEIQEILLKQGFAALRTSYEALIIFDMLNEVVQRFHEVISPGRMNKICWSQEIAVKIIDRYGIISRYIEGHSHSDNYLAEKPTCAMLRSEIDEFHALKKEINKFKNAS